MRRYHYHVLTPLHRIENAGKMLKMLEPQKVNWHVVMDVDEPFDLRFRRQWVHHYLCNTEGVEFWARCNFSLNFAMGLMDWRDNDRYCFLNDDDAVEPGFFDKVDTADGEVVAVSMLRGNKTPDGVAAERAHGTNELVAAPENMKVGFVGVEQLIVSGRILRQCRLPIHICGDGQMIEYITQTNPVTYLPEAKVWFNYFEPGRWE